MQRHVLESDYRGLTNAFWLQNRSQIGVKWSLMGIIVTCAICLMVFHRKYLASYYIEFLHLQEGEPVDYTWTRMKTHKNQLRIRNSQVLTGNVFISLSLQLAGVWFWDIFVQRSQRFWIGSGSTRTSCVRFSNAHIILTWVCFPLYVFSFQMHQIVV